MNLPDVGCRTIFKWNVNEESAILSCVTENGQHMVEESCSRTCNTASHKVLLNTGMVYKCDVRLSSSETKPKYSNYILARGMEMYKNFKEEDLVPPEVENGSPDLDCEI